MFHARQRIHRHQPVAPQLPRRDVSRLVAQQHGARGHEQAKADQRCPQPKAGLPVPGADDGPEEDGGRDAVPRARLANHQRRRLAVPGPVAGHVLQVLHVHGGEDDAADDEEPAGGVVVELALRRLAGDAQGAAAVEGVGHGDDQVAHDEAVVRAAQVVVHPRQAEQDGRLLRGPDAEVDQGQRQRDGDEEQAPRLVLGDAAGGQWPPGLVELVLQHRLGAPLVGQVEDERVEPGPEQHQRHPLQDQLQAGRVVGGEQRAGQGAEDAEDGLGEDKGLHVAQGEEPDGVEEAPEPGQWSGLHLAADAEQHDPGLRRRVAQSAQEVRARRR